ncbi:hypothetical protein CISIN_1g0074372mg, partial [Citrus sinensis]
MNRSSRKFRINRRYVRPTSSTTSPSLTATGDSLFGATILRL